MRTVDRRPPFLFRLACVILALTAGALPGLPAEASAQAGLQEFPRVPQPEADLAPDVRARYQEDAARLAARHLAEAGARDDVALPPALVASLYNALARVFQTNHPSRDFAVEKHRVHTFGNPPLRELIVGVHPGQAWAEAWKRGERLTGNEAIDALMKAFDLSVERGHILRARDPVNVAALARRFAAIPGVRYAEPNAVIGDGNDIRARAEANGWRLEYSAGMGDCPAGCTQRYGWTFLVTTDGRVTFVGSTGSPEDRAGQALPLLTKIKAIRALSQDDGARGYPVRIRAVVTHFDEKRTTDLMVHDGEWGQFVVPPARMDSAWRALRRGDAVEIEGRTVRGGFAPNVQPEHVRVIGRAPLPPARSVPYSVLLSGRHDCDYIEIVGVVQRAWRSANPAIIPLFADVAIEGGIVRAAFWDYTAADLAHLVDARVRLRGNAGAIFSPTEQIRGVSLFGGRVSDTETLEAPPDPFSLPARPIRSIYHYSATGEVNRRIRVRGVVTARIVGQPFQISDFTTAATFQYVRHVLYVRDATSGVRIETEQDTPVHPGEIVDVAGFPSVTPGKPILRNALFKVVGPGEQPAPIAVRTANALTPENDAELVRMQAQLLSVLSSPTHRALVLKIGETVFDADLDKAQVAALDDIRPGSLVAVTGVYSYQTGPPPSFRLFLRSPADLTLVRAAQWWSQRHTAVVLAVIAIVAGIAILWVRMMAHRKRQQYQAILHERNRVARELHDTLEQGLAGISLQLEAVAGSLEASPYTARRSLDVARQMLRYSLEEARRSVLDLRSQALDSRDLAGALSDLARQMTMGTPARAEVRTFGTPRQLDAAQEHHLLRIGLEALTNALKHAGATRIDLELRFAPDTTELVVSDDGCGLGHGEHDIPGAHFGLQGVRERVNKLGGVLQIDSGPQRGTRLAVTVPSAPSIPTVAASL
jgi:signal transduction histidine kinase